MDNENLKCSLCGTEFPPKTLKCPYCNTLVQREALSSVDKELLDDIEQSSVDHLHYDKGDPHD